MLTIETIADRLGRYRPAARRGDHLLNPGMTVPPPWKPAAVLIPLLTAEDGVSVLFTERSLQLTVHAGQISFPGGRQEAQDETPAATALREAREEIGLLPENVTLLGRLDDYLTRTGFCVTPVVGLVGEAQPEWTPDRREVARIFTVPLAHILGQGGLREETALADPERRRFYACRWEGAHIWGATAGMLKNLTEVIAK